MQIRGSFGLWNKPKPKDDDDDDDDGEGKKPKVKIIDDTKKDSIATTQDSAKIDTSVVQDSAKVADSLKTAVQDSAGTAPVSSTPAPQDAPKKSADPANVKSKGD